MALEISIVAVLAIAFGLMIWKFGLKVWQGILALLFGFYLGKSPTFAPLIDDIVQAFIGRA